MLFIVDAESLTGATHLYETAGFKETRRSLRMARPQAQHARRPG